MHTNLEGNGPDGLRKAHQDLAQLGVWGGREQELLQAVPNLKQTCQTRSRHVSQMGCLTTRHELSHVEAIDDKLSIVASQANDLRFYAEKCLPLSANVCSMR